NFGGLVFPIGDGEAAPFSASLDVVGSVSAKTGLSCNALMLTRHPERHVNACAAAGCAAMTISLEDAAHPHRILTRIKESGMSAGIALNPATSLVALEYLLDKADIVCLLGVEPWSADDAKAAPALIERVKMLSENIRYRELRTDIMLYGGLSIHITGKAIAAGASRVVLDRQLMEETGQKSFVDAANMCFTLLHEALEKT
ncbi:MAG TPA: hypothetical protein ENN29_05640, partial [Candidatus Hydrogenedentes bacterium]|nr:hypothetical protein [Candidatus Hydrogenedentota bacterium]